MQRASRWLAAGALALALAPAIGGGGALAADLFVVHGINGTDLGLDEDFEVDVEVIPLGATTGLCLTEPGEALGEPLAFGDVAGPIEDLIAGIRQVVLSLADGTPCSGTPQVVGLVIRSAFDTALVVAHLDANGAPRVSSFTVNVSELGNDEGRISAIHAAAAGAVDIEVEDAATFADVQNGEQIFPLTLQEGRYGVRILDAATGDRLARKNIKVDPGEVGVGIAVGSAANDTLEVLRVILDAAG